MAILTYILSCIYFFLPAYFTNMTPPLAKKIGIFNFLAKPVDFNKKFLGEPILGNHKTWRGVILGIFVGMSVAKIQQFLFQYSFFKKISFLNYQEINIVLFGFLISLGTILGDLFFAFIKRRLKLKPGEKFLPWDQINYVLGAAILLTPIFKIDMIIWITILFLTFFLHIIVNRLGFILKIHEAKW